MINQDKLRMRVRSRIRTLQDMAIKAKMGNAHFSRWLNGKDVTEETAEKIRKSLIK